MRPLRIQSNCCEQLLICVSQLSLTSYAEDSLVSVAQRDRDGPRNDRSLSVYSTWPRTPAHRLNFWLEISVCTYLLLSC